MPRHTRTSIDFDELHGRYFPEVFAYVARRIRDRALAEEVAQETFLRAFRARARFDVDRPVWPWLQRIANNLLINAIRNEHRRRSPLRLATEDEVVRHPDADRSVDPEAAFENNERRTVIHSVLDELSPRSRRVLLRRVSDDLTYDEIAEAEGLSNDAVKAVLKRARRKFRIAFTNRWDGEFALVLWPLRRLGARLRRTGAEASVFLRVAPMEALAPIVASGVAVATIAGALLLGDGVRPQRAYSAPSHRVEASQAANTPKRTVTTATSRNSDRMSSVSGPADVRATVSPSRTASRRQVRVQERDGSSGGRGTDLGAQLPCHVTSTLCATADVLISAVP